MQVIAFAEEMDDKYTVPPLAERLNIEKSGVMNCELNESNASIHTLFSKNG